MEKTQHNLNLVQLLRGIASLLVVLLHVTANVNENLHISFFSNFFAFGGAGVDIFFVLSGFIITYASKKALSNNGGWLTFLKRRFIRIFPTYWIIITAFIVLQKVFPLFYKTHYSLSAANLLSTYFLLPDHIMINGVSWTLSYELFFYALFSVAFIIRNKKILWFLSMAFVATLILLSILHINSNENRLTKLVFFPMNVEFFLGILIAILLPYINKSVAPIMILTGTVVFLIDGILSNNGYTIFNSNFNRVVLFGIPSFFIILGIVKYEIAQQIKVHSILVSLGEASYSLYLIHLPIVAAMAKIMARLHLANSVLIHIVLLIGLFIICAISILFFKWIEKPLITRLNKMR